MAERRSTGLRNLVGSPGGKSYGDALAAGVLRIFSGAQPLSADDTETGTLLVEITVDGGVFTPGNAAHGLHFDNAADGIIPKLASELWQGTVVATGYAGWFRFYANDRVTGASTTAVRMDGAISTGTNSEIQMSNTKLTIGETPIIDTFNITV